MFETESVSYTPLDIENDPKVGGEVEPMETESEKLEETVVETEQTEDGDAEPGTVDAKPEEVEEVEEAPEEMEEDNGGEEKAPKDGIQKRMDKLTKRWRDTERENLKLKTGFEAERDALRAKIGELENKGIASKKPMPDDFETTEEYVDALVEFKTTAGMDKIRSDAQADSARTNANAKHEKLEAKLSEGQKAHDDFDDIVRSKDLPINAEMVGICSELDSAAEVLYFLGKNPGECASIATLSPIQMAIKLTGIEHSITQPKTKKVSKAPRPINPLTARGKMQTKTLSQMTNAEYRKKRGYGK